MSNMRRGQAILGESSRAEQQQTGHCWARAHRAYAWFTYQSISLPVFAFASLYFCRRVCVGLCRFQFQFQNISTYLAPAICRDYWHLPYSLIEMEIDFHNLIDWLTAMWNSEKHVYNLWITQLALHSLLVCPFQLQRALLIAFKLRARRFTDVVPPKGCTKRRDATRYTPSAN